MTTGLFVGLITLDVMYLTPHLPAPNQKIVAQDYAIAAGGPATNAAIAFQYLEHLAQQATRVEGARSNLAAAPTAATRLMGVLGRHALSQFALADLQQRAIEVIDLDPDCTQPLPTSSILVTQATGDRAVVSLNATRSQVSDYPIAQALAGVEVVLIDGHQMAIGRRVAQQAKAQQIPVVIDAGSWKPGFETVLPLADYVICSAHFYPPGCTTHQDVFAYLQASGVPHLAITRGAEPILCRSAAETGQSQANEIPVPAAQVIDTLGAGDVLHGAFCHFVVRSDFKTALDQAARIAAQSCQSFGTRAWMTQPFPA